MVKRDACFRRIVAKMTFYELPLFCPYFRGSYTLNPTNQSQAPVTSAAASSH